MANLLKGKNLVETLIRGNSFNGFFGIKKEDAGVEEEQDEGPDGSRAFFFIKEFCPLANVVASRCAKVLLLSLEELQQQFEDEMPNCPKSSPNYARNLLEYCSVRAVAVTTQVTDYLSDKDFRKFTFDMMLAWETPGVMDKPILLVNAERSAGKQAFVRLGPAISGIADSITVHSQFDALTASTGGRLPLSVYDNYLTELDKTIKAMKNNSSLPYLSKFQMVKGESVIEVDGTVTSQPVLQHEGVSTWPGRLTLTDHTLYFEPIGVGSFDKPKKFDIAANLRPVVKPELTGPWGARLFDKAIQCKSMAVLEPLIIEFPELTGHARRDYWLAIIRELVCAHQFISKYQLEHVAKMEALSRAALGIARLRATREANHSLPFKPESLLTFLTGQQLPGGDLIMEALSQSLCSGWQGEASLHNGVIGSSEKVQLYARLGAPTRVASISKRLGKVDEAAFAVGDFLIGDLNPLEKAVSQSRNSSKKVELAQSTIDGVKVEGIDTNIAVMKELVLPISAFIDFITALRSWDEPFKTAAFLIFISYIVLKDLHRYVVPMCILCMAGFMLWFRQGQNSQSGELYVMSPASQNAIEQLLALQQGLTDLKELLQSGNILFLKIRAIIFSTLPQATNQVLMVLVALAFVLAVLPFKLLVLLVLWEVFTRQTLMRQESTERMIRRLKEWWYIVPVVPVRLEKFADEKKRAR